MSGQPRQTGTLFRKPPRTVFWLLLGLLAIWMTFAIGLNWGGADPELFAILTGDGQAVLNGQLWRLLTAAMVHIPSGNGAVAHVAFSLLILYFFAPALHDRWGSRRLLLFLMASAMFAYGVETIAYWLVPGTAQRAWLGGMVLGDAAVVAWAVNARGQRVLFFLVLPMRPMVMIALMIGWHIMVLVARESNPEGLFAPFAAMAAGYLFGETSPLRRLYLRLRLQRLQTQAAGLPDFDDDEPVAPDEAADFDSFDDDDEPPEGRVLH